MTPLWTSAAIADATGGTASHDFVCGGVAFDSREIVSGDLFLALKGEESDGHIFLEKAFANGAVGAVVNIPIDQPHVLVTETTQALNDLAKAARARSQAKIIGVTGSAGKTGTKEALFAALDRCSRGHAHRSVKSYNNHVGVPLSLARMPANAQYAVLEMGMNHPGELRELTALVRPDVAIITTIAPAHIGFFKDEAEIAAAKAEIFESLEPGGTAIVPADSPHSDFLHAVAEKYAARVVTFGFDRGADIHAVDHVMAVGGGSVVTAQMGDRLLSYTLSQPGDHWIANSLAVLAAVEAVGGDLAVSGLALADMAGLAGRGARHEIIVGGGSALLIDESYNANPASMRATISDLGKTGGARLIAVLGSMKELGSMSDHYHSAIADDLYAANVNYALLVGEEMEILAKNLANGVEKQIEFDHCLSSSDATGLIKAKVAAGDTILVKGSNSMGLANVVKALREGDA